MQPVIRFILFFLLLFTSILSAQNLAVINLQGVVRDEQGGAVDDGDYQFEFNIYDALTGGTSLWTETQTLTVSSGVYSVNLGDSDNGGKSFDDGNSGALGFDVPYYLGVSFNGGNEISPRVRLTAAPYALSLQGADNVFPSSGNVGVGINNPEDQLHVLGNSLVDGNSKVKGDITLERDDNTSSQTLKFNTGTSNDYSIGQEDNDHFYFWHGDDKVMSFSSSTNSTQIKYDLNVAGAAEFSSTVEANNLTIDGKAPFVFRNYTKDKLGNSTSAAEVVDYNTGVSISDYLGCIIGFDAGTGDIDESGNENLWVVKMYENSSTGTWYLKLRSPTHSYYPDWDINVLYIQRELVQFD